MKLLLMIFTLLFLTNTKSIHMSSETSNPGSIKLKKLLTIIDNEDGFYDRVVTKKVKTNRYASLDLGNRRIVLFDEQGSKLMSFGKEGNGPGEISRPQTIFGNETYLYVIDNGRATIFDYNGNYINSIKERGWPNVYQDRIVYDFSSRTNTKILKKYYSIDGNLKKEIKNENYSESYKAPDYFDEKRIKDMLTRPYGQTDYRDGFLQVRRGAYQIEYITANLITIITRDFKRIKSTRSPIPVRVEGKRTKEIDDNIKKMNAAAEAITGGFLTDISYIIGSYENYILVKPTSESNTEIIIDIISPEFQLYDQLKLNGDEFRSISIHENFLIINRTNEDDGPYSEIYQLSIQ